MIRPTELALRGLEIPVLWDDPLESSRTACMFCGFLIPSGQARFAYKPGASFSDWQYLAARTNVLCAACVRFTENSILMATSHCVINKHGAWSLRKDEQLAWLFTTPPEPPFVVVWSDAQKAHLMWRATVSLDDNLIYVQIGRERISVDRALLAHALEWSQELVDIAVAHGEDHFAGRRHPFIALDRKREDLSHGQLSERILKLSAHDARARDLIGNLLAIGEGERWALAVLAKRNPVAPKAQPLAAV